MINRQHIDPKRRLCVIQEGSNISKNECTLKKLEAVLVFQIGIPVYFVHIIISISSAHFIKMIFIGTVAVFEFDNKRSSDKSLQKWRSRINRQIFTCLHHRWRKLFQNGGGTNARQHNCTKFLRFEMATVTSQALKYDVIPYTPYEGINYTILDKIAPLWKRIG